MSRRHLLPAVLLGLTLLLAPPADAPVAQAAADPRPFAVYVDDYYDAYFAWKPSEGTGNGLHQYDSQLEDWSAAATAKRLETLKKLQKRLETLRAGALNADEAIDAEVLDGMLKSERLDIETVRSWRRNPMGYVGTPPGAIDGLMKRNFAPAAVRLRAVIARLEATPPLLLSLRTNVENPPREFTDLAIRMASGSVDFYKVTVRDWAKEAAGNDAELLARFEKANAAAAKAMAETAIWLKNDLLPRSKGTYAIGADAFAKQLLYEELVDTPLDKLLAIGEANLKRDHDAFVAIARQIDPKKTPAEVMKALSDDHPTEAELVPATRQTIAKIRRFLIDKHIVTIPSEVLPTVMETPPYARNGGFASMDTPGAFETKATEAFYYVTPPEKAWPAAQKEEHLRMFNRPVLQVVTIHEAFPGHYIQFLNAKQFPTKTRKLAFCGSNVEGWAHYTEQMMIEEGYGNGDLKIRLAQLSEALLRDCRWVVGMKLHTQGMTVEEGARFFEKQGFQEPSSAYEESRRGAYNPTYLYYTLGKLQIYKLRDDYRKANGKDFKLETFHNEFVRQGGIPIKLVRRILLPDDKGSTL